MPRKNKARHTNKQKPQANHIEDSEKKNGKSPKTAARTAWATENKNAGGARKKGAGPINPTLEHKA